MTKRLAKLVPAIAGVLLAVAGYCGAAKADDGDISLNTYLTITDLGGKLLVDTNLPTSPSFNGIYALGTYTFPNVNDLHNAISIDAGGIVYPDINSFNFIDPNNAGYYDTIYISPSGNHGTTGIAAETLTTDLDFGKPACDSNTYCPILAAGSSSTVNYTAHTGAFGSTIYAGQLTVKFIALGASVPEPATWAMFLIGFGAIGGTLRARKRGRTAPLPA